MPRPLRIEYENAYYHVMNRERRQQDNFHSQDYYDAFLSTREEAHRRFGVQNSILLSERGKKNIPRWVALYLCQEERHRLIDIVKKFELKRTGSIPTVIGKLKTQLNGIVEKLENIESIVQVRQKFEG
jgi:hypothetical protein